MNKKLRTALATGLAAWSMWAGAASITITPSTDPGNVFVGDSLTFTLSVDSITPPAGLDWERFGIGLFRRVGPGPFEFESCENLSGLSSVELECHGYWDWVFPSPATAQTLTGDLVSFTIQFNEPGTYSFYLERARATFSEGLLNPVSVELAVTNTRDNPIFIDVGTAQSVPEPATFALLGIALAGLGFARRDRLR